MMGKEKDDEIKGNGNSYDFAARIYDSRLGKWLSIDPKASKYPYFSPYVGLGDNPVYYVDPGGETLKVSAASPTIIEQYQTMVSRAFNGKIQANIDNGAVTFHKIPDTEELTEYEKAAFNELNKVTSSKTTANIKLVDNSKDVATDEFYSSQMDVSDVESYGNDDNTLSSKTILVHAAVEQLQKANYERLLSKKITEENDYNGGYYEASHSDALDAEAKTTNLVRLSGEGNEVVFDGDKNGFEGNGILKTNEGQKSVKYILNIGIDNNCPYVKVEPKK